MTAAVILVLVLQLLAVTVATAACFKAVGDAYLGERAHVGTSVRFALRKAHSVLWVTILSTLLAGIGFILLVVPGVYLWVSFAVAVPVLLMEGVRGRRALGRSRQLVRGRWWPAFGLILVGTLLAVIVAIVIDSLATAAVVTAPEDNDLAVFAVDLVSGAVGNVLITPFVAAFVVVLYFDLRVRKEGFDLQLLAERVGVAPDPALLARPAPPLPEPEPTGAEPPFWPPPPGWRPPTSDDPDRV
jgi:hypothetical protein